MQLYGNSATSAQRLDAHDFTLAVHARLELGIGVPEHELKLQGLADLDPHFGLEEDAGFADVAGNARALS